MSAQITLINVFALVVVCKLVSGAAADLPLAAVRAQCVDAAFTRHTVMRTQQTLIDIFAVFSISFQLEPVQTGAGAVQTSLSTTCSFALILCVLCIAL